MNESRGSKWKKKLSWKMRCRMRAQRMM
jgi:hypothetical protein